MLALLGLVAVAGYQNRDKIGAALNNLQTGAGGGSQDGLGGLLGGLGGGGLAGGLGELINSFRSAGHGDVANSWVDPSVPTRGLRPDQVEQAVGEENLRELAQRTGLSREELVERLSKTIPETVDRLTPNGQMPTEEEARQRLMSGA